MAIKPNNVNRSSSNGNRCLLRRQRKERKEQQGQERQGQKEKESTEISKRTIPSLRATAAAVESGGRKQKDCRYRNTVVEVAEEQFVDQTSGSASSSTNRVTPALPGLSSAGIAQPTTGMISTLMEGHVQSGWLCELETGTDDSKSRENETIELLVDTGATEHVCGPYDFTHVALNKGVTTSAQNCGWRAVETLRNEDRELPVSRTRTSSRLHSCRREETNAECLAIDGQRHRNTSRWSLRSTMPSGCSAVAGTGG